MTALTVHLRTLSRSVALCMYVGREELCSVYDGETMTSNDALPCVFLRGIA